MLISNYDERLRRSRDSEFQILKFLRDETFSSPEILAQIVNISSRAIYKKLNSMNKKGLIHRHKYEGFAFNIWGITQLGLAHAWGDDEEMEFRTPFQTSRVKPLMIPHELDVQTARIKAESAGWSDWVSGKQLPLNLAKRPDAIVTNQFGDKVAIELERTIKSRQRLEKIWSIYLQQITRKEIDMVHYVCPDVGFAKRLKRVFSLLKTIPVAGERVVLTGKHRSKFIISSLTSWPI